MVDTKERNGLRAAGRGLWDFKFHSEEGRKPTEEAGKEVTSEHLFCAMNCSMPGFPVLHHLLEFDQTHVH